MDELKIARRMAFERLTGKPYPKDSEVTKCNEKCANYEGPVEFREKYCCAGKTFQGWTEIAKCTIGGNVHFRDCRLGACISEKKKL